MREALSVIAVTLAVLPCSAQEIPRQTPGLALARAEAVELMARGIPDEGLRIAYVKEKGRALTYVLYYPTPTSEPLVMIGGRAVPASRLAEAVPVAIMRLRVCTPAAPASRHRLLAGQMADCR